MTIIGFQFFAAIWESSFSSSWFLGTALNPAHSTLLAPVVDDEDVAIFVDAYRNAWPAK